jgi:hypothetical protein
MAPDVANRVNALLCDASGLLDESVQVVKDSCPKEEFERYRLAVGKIMGAMYLDLMSPLIYTDHPDLDIGIGGVPPNREGS